MSLIEVHPIENVLNPADKVRSFKKLTVPQVKICAA